MATMTYRGILSSVSLYVASNETLSTSVGIGMSSTALTFLGSDFMPSSVSWHPMKLTSCSLKRTFSTLRTRFLSWHLLRNACRFVSCSASSFPVMKKPPAITSVPSSNPSMVSARIPGRWKCQTAYTSICSIRMVCCRCESTWIHQAIFGVYDSEYTRTTESCGNLFYCWHLVMLSTDSFI